MPTHANTAGQGARDRNCANCSAAGIVRMVSGKQLTSGQVANGTADDKPDASAVGGIDGQLRLIDQTVRKNTWRPGHWFGNAADERAYDETMAWMRQHPDGTVFAVYASGPIVNEGIGRTARSRGGMRVNGALALDANSVTADNIAARGGKKSHFLTAKNNRGQLQFRDFQTDVANGRGVTESDVPVLGICTAVSPAQAGSPGTFTQETRFVVVAYAPVKWVSAQPSQAALARGRW